MTLLPSPNFIARSRSFCRRRLPIQFFYIWRDQQAGRPAGRLAGATVRLWPGVAEGTTQLSTCLLLAQAAPYRHRTGMSDRPDEEHGDVQRRQGRRADVVVR